MYRRLVLEALYCSLAETGCQSLNIQWGGASNLIQQVASSDQMYSSTPTHPPYATPFMTLGCGRRHMNSMLKVKAEKAFRKAVSNLPREQSDHLVVCRIKN